MRYNFLSRKSGIHVTRSPEWKSRRHLFSTSTEAESSKQYQITAKSSNRGGVDKLQSVAWSTESLTTFLVNRLWLPLFINLVTKG